MDTMLFLKDEVLLSRTKEFSREVEDNLSMIRHDRILKPVIYIGTGTCGLVAGAGATLNAVNNYLSEKQLEVEVIEVGCIGLCSSEPLLDVQLPGKSRISFHHVTAQKVEALLDDIFNGEVPAKDVLGQFRNPLHQEWDGIPAIEDIPFFRMQHRLVLKQCGRNNPSSLPDYIARGGYLSFVKCIRNYTASNICNIVEDSGLRGRGGGGFNTGKKWKIAQSTESDQKFLICNADESDPGAFMDRAVIEGNPHLLIEGIAIAAYATGAAKAYVYIRAEYQLAIKRLQAALLQAREFGLLGYNVFGSGVDLNIVISQGAGAFVCGEETALINSIEGKRGMPKPKPPFPAVRGLFGKPTVINNVETLANIPYILRHGPQKFNTIGTKNSKGTKVFALSGKAAITGLIEVPMGTTIRDIIFKIAGGIKEGKAFKAVQIGGPSGSCLPDQLLDIPVDYESLWESGAIMGSGGIVVMDEDTCMVDISKFFMDFLKNESCGKCIPCREGTRRMHEILLHITQRPANEAGHETLERFKGIIQLENLATVIRDTSLCGLGQTSPNPVLSAMKYFREEFEEHIFDRKCQAGVCKDLRIFYIDVEKCTGCTVCAKKCPENAIIGQPRAPHFIVEDKCIGCGICFDVCKFVAVFVK
jgi:NADH:ubiquinone oxidoreductase subunit F (NADH-binding)/Pyruvate/2-oxoacid:ferredoxin oxidoreductase delta subunit/(2Fe-2S) ferredoxin